MQQLKQFSVLALLPALLVLTACAGGEKPTNPQSPASIAGSIQRNQHLTGAAAKTHLDGIHQKTPGTSETWVSSYGDNDRIWVYATGFPTAEAAAASIDAMTTRLQIDTPKFSKLAPGMVGQQPGHRMQSIEDKKQVFVYTKGRWMIAVRAIAADLEPTVYSIEWIPAS